MWEWVQVSDLHFHSPMQEIKASSKKPNQTNQIHAKQIPDSKTINDLKMLVSEENSVMALIVYHTLEERARN